MFSTTNTRAGFALPIALFAVVVVGALIAVASFAATQEYRIARNALVEQRAFAAAEAGLNGVLARWGAGGTYPPLNLPVQGDDTTYTVATAAGDAAVVTLTRLTDSTVWVVSEGTAAPGSAQLRSVRRTNLVLRASADTLRPVAHRSWAQLF